MPTEEGAGDKWGLEEIEGGIGVDSCASDNVSARRHLKGMGYKIKPSAGSKRGQRWGSASGHSIENEGEVSYKFMTESGSVNRGTTQIGEVRRPLAAVSKITEAGNRVIFSKGDDWIIDRRDEVADAILKLVRKAQKKVKMYQHKGTYRMRAWLMPEKEGASGNKGPFGRPGR